MRFMMFMYPGEKDETKWDPQPEDIEAMMAYNEQLTRAGVLLALDGLKPPSAGATVRGVASGRPVVTDGPFAEAKELVGGYWVIDVKSKDEAVAWASRCPLAAGDTIEVRPVFELEDFSPEAQEAVRAGELSSPPPQQPQR